MASFFFFHLSAPAKVPAHVLGHETIPILFARTPEVTFLSRLGCRVPSPNGSLFLLLCHYCSRFVMMVKNLQNNRLYEMCSLSLLLSCSPLFVATFCGPRCPSTPRCLHLFLSVFGKLLPGLGSSPCCPISGWVAYTRSRPLCFRAAPFQILVFPHAPLGLPFHMWTSRRLPPAFGFVVPTQLFPCLFFF